LAVQSAARFATGVPAEEQGGNPVLTLSRKTGQKVWIGPDITLVVVEVGDGFVRLGVEAPRSVAVDRAEVRARKLAAAAEVPPCKP
jgi:carbon storage regulator